MSGTPYSFELDQDKHCPYVHVNTMFWYHTYGQLMAVAVEGNMDMSVLHASHNENVYAHDVQIFHLY